MIHWCVCHGQFICGITNSNVTWHIHMWHDFFIRVSWLIHTWHGPRRKRDMTHFYVALLIHTWHDSFICDMTHSSVICKCNMTHWLNNMWHDSLRLINWHVCHKQALEQRIFILKKRLAAAAIKKIGILHQYSLYVTFAPKKLSHISRWSHSMQA